MNTASFFTPYFNNARINSILIMSCDGVILDINQAFTNNFGYNNEDIAGQNFSILFTKEDRQKKLPELELQNVAATGQSTDENYVVDKDGKSVWALGESLLVSDPNGGKFVVKDIINLQAKRQIEFFLTDTEDLLERVFESSKEIPMMIVDGSLKIIKANKPFLHLFEITEELPPGSRLSEIPHAFWKSADIRKEISSIIIRNQPLRNRKFFLETKDGKKKTLRFDSRIVDSKIEMERKIFITIDNEMN